MKNFTKNDLVLTIMAIIFFTFLIIGIIKFGFWEVVMGIMAIVAVIAGTILYVFLLYKLCRWIDEHGDEPAFKNKSEK